MTDVSASIAPFLRLAVGGWHLETGGGLRMGWADLRGTARDDTAAESGGVSGIWLGPMLDVRGLLPLTESIELSLDFEGGAVVHGVVGRTAGTPGIGADGQWLRLGVSVLWWVP